MKITLLGAAGEVTGSGYLVETSKARVLVDLGMFQGGGRGERTRKNAVIDPIEPAKLDAVVLTHAHLDHVGRMPLLIPAGYKGSIYTTPATIDLAELILRDSAHIQESDAFRENKYRDRSGHNEPDAVPLYTTEHVEKLLPMFAPLPLDQWKAIAPGISVRLYEAGHILGSASVEMRVHAAGEQEKIIVFSGDIGPAGVPILRDPNPPKHADLVFVESTYGDRDHRPLDQTVAEFRRVITEASWNKSRVLMPAFAVGRTQLILHYLGEIYADARTPRIPVLVDSPMASKASQLYCKHAASLDDDGPALCSIGKPFGDLSFARAVESAAESKALNESWDPAIIVAASGMCDGGRILHHLKHNLWRKGVTFLATGYMPEGSLGRRILDGAPTVRIMGQTVAVRAKIATLGGFSAHTGQSGLMAWLGAMAGDASSKPRVVLVHGEDRQRGQFAAKIRDRFGIEASSPLRFDVVEI